MVNLGWLHTESLCTGLRDTMSGLALLSSRLKMEFSSLKSTYFNSPQVNCGLYKIHRTIYECLLFSC
jgi:hypothetical protein